MLSLVVMNDHIVNITSVAAAGFFIIGAQFVLNNFTAASYETSVRATAVGMELGVARVGAILGPFVAGALQQILPEPDADVPVDRRGSDCSGRDHPAGPAAGDRPRDRLEEAAGLRKVGQPAS